MPKALFGRETGTRTLVSAVRGRRPRPLDDISIDFKSPRSIWVKASLVEKQGVLWINSTVNYELVFPQIRHNHSIML